MKAHFTEDRMTIVTDKGHGVFGCWFEGGNCCGIAEMYELIFTYPPTSEEEACKAFQETLMQWGAKRKKAFVHLTLSRYAHVHQAAWFVKALEAYPGAIKSEWRLNPNSGNEIQFWILPV